MILAASSGCNILFRPPCTAVALQYKLYQVALYREQCRHNSVCAISYLCGHIPQYFKRIKNKLYVGKGTVLFLGLAISEMKRDHRIQLVKFRIWPLFLKLIVLQMESSTSSSSSRTGPTARDLVLLLIPCILAAVIDLQLKINDLQYALTRDAPIGDAVG